MRVIENPVEWETGDILVYRDNSRNETGVWEYRDGRWNSTNKLSMADVRNLTVHGQPECWWYAGNVNRPGPVTWIPMTDIYGHRVRW